MIFSQKITNILTQMRTNKVAKILLDSNTPTPYNYIDITSTNDIVNFISAKKVDEVISKMEKTYMVVKNDKYLSHNKSNSRLFKLLGYEPKDKKPTRPEMNTLGKAINEAFGKDKKKKYCLFQFTSENKVCKIPLNMEYLVEKIDLSLLWTKNRNNIKIGRFAKSVALHLEKEVSDSDIETFVNEFKCIYDIESNIFKKFDLVKGVKLSKFYKRTNYISGCSGQLSQSCMREVPSRYFNLYKDNDVKLLVLYDDNGKLVKNKYVSDKIKARALVWEGMLIGKKKVTYIDRIYTHSDSDIKLIREYAKQNDWYFSDGNGGYTNGMKTIKGTLTYKLKKAGFTNYPYCDSLYYLDAEKGTLSNSYDNSNSIKTLRRTDGSYN